MDVIQKVLIKAGRKDLAQEYFKKVAACELEEVHRQKDEEELMFIKESDGFIENMISDKDLTEAIEKIKKVWERWKVGPMTESSHIRPARKELIDYIKTILEKRLDFDKN